MSSKIAQPAWSVKKNNTTKDRTNSDADLSSRESVEVERQLQDRAVRLSRLSTRLQSSAAANKANPTMKLKQFEVDQMTAQLQELQDTMKKEEEERRRTDAREKKRAAEEAEILRKTQNLEKMYQQMDPSTGNPHLSVRAQRRRTAMLSLKDTNGWTKEEWEAIEKREKEEEEKEKKETDTQREMTEKKLREIEVQIKKKEKMREEERLTKQKQQLSLMEQKLKKLEHSLESGDDETISESDLQRELEKRSIELKDKRDREKKERERQLAEEERIRREREDQLYKRKIEMERRLRELEGSLAEKQREKEEEQLRQQQLKIERMEKQLVDLENGVEPEELSAAKQSLDYRLMEKKLKEMEAELERRKAGDGGGYGGLPNSKLDALFSKLDRLDKLDDLFNKLNNLTSLPMGMMGNGGGRPAGTSAEDLKKEIETLQKILFDPNSTDKDIAEANIKLEKVMLDYEKTPEYQMEIQRQKAEKRAKHEPLNKEALKKMKQIYNPQNVKTNPELLQKIGENPELRFLFMEPDTILKLHTSDFKAFSLRGLALEELRAIRACMPNFRKDQKVQQDWVDGLDEKIENMSSAPPASPKPNKPAKAIKLPKPKKGAVAGDVFAELLAHKNKLTPVGNRGGGDDDDGPRTPSAPAAAPKQLSFPPLPPKQGFPTLPPKGGPPTSPNGATPAPKAAPKPAEDIPSQAAIDQFKKVKACLEKLLKGIISGTATEKDIATDTRITVQEIKNLAKIQKVKYSDPCTEMEDSASELVVAVKGVLMSKKSQNTSELNTSKQKLATVIDSIRTQATKPLGPNGKDYVK